MKKCFEEIVYRLMLALVWVLGSMPLSLGRRCGSIFGWFAYRMATQRRQVVLENLALAFPEKSLAERALLTRRIFANMGMLVFEIFWSHRLDKESFADYFRIEGREHLERAYAKDGGVLILTGHLGSWETLKVIGFMVGYPISVLYRPLDYAPLERLITRMRARLGAHQIPRKKAFRQIIRALEEKHLVGLLFDQHVKKKEGIYVPFFGRPVATSNGLALLALKTEAPVVPLFLLREENGFCAQFLPEIPLAKTGDKFQDLKQNSAAYNLAIEGIIRRYPEQWLWLHRRWRSKDLSNWEEQEKSHPS